jgi:hypothetical protein
MPYDYDARTLLDSQTILGFVAALGIGSFLGSVIPPVITSHYEERKLARERRIANLEKSIDKLWRLLFYFGNMESWGRALGVAYSFGSDVLGRYLGEMLEMMKSEIYVGSVVRQLWLDWQPYAVASVQKLQGKPSHSFYTKDEFERRSRELHKALRDEYEKRLKEYELEAGHSL